MPVCRPPALPLPLHRRAILGLIGGGAALTGLPRAARAEGRCGQVAALTGEGVVRGGSERALAVGGDLLVGDLVEMAPEGRTTLQLDLGALIHLGPATQLRLDTFVTALSGEMTLGTGAIVFDRDDSLPPADIAIRTSFGSIGVRGTRFFAGPSNGVFGIFAERGRVAVQTAAGAVELTAGQGADVSAEGTMSGVVTWGQARIDAAFASVLP